MHVHLLPDLVAPESLGNRTAVVIDVLRATTTIVHALAAGAREVIPCLEVSEARQIAQKFPASERLLGGERQGVRIEGFDLGNSPTEYTPESVAGKTIVFTTTNGTRAMQRCRQARRVLLAGFVNLSAVVQSLARERDVHIVCAGTRGEITREDALVAGALVDAFVQTGNPSSLNDEARLVRDAWLAVPGRKIDRITALTKTLYDTQGGRNLIAEGFEHNIATAALFDRFDIVPTLDTQAWTIRSR
jgi:2-phosphosulfolactate phosphatase